jgi:PKD repeat protein
MKRKYSLLMLLSIFLSVSIFAQVTKSIVDENKVIISTNKDFLDIEPNVMEDFETYDDFATTFAPWILIDVDGLPTYGIQDVTFPNSGTAMAYIIFNPNNTDPSMGDDPEIAAHSGDKFAACFSSVPSGGETNDDWLITPSLSLEENSHLSFFGKSYTLEYGAEKLKVLVSTSGTSQADFTEISSGTIELPEDWTAYNYDLTAYDNSDIYIAFQCLSEDAFILMLDDILVTTEEVVVGSTLSGKVTNAIDGMPIEGALVEVADLSDYTNAQGNYLIENVPQGTLVANYTGTPTQGLQPLTVQFTDLSTSNTQLVSCSATDFITYNNNQVTIPPDSVVNLDISLSPILGVGQMRFVLNWGADPSDLDEHLRTPEIEGSQYHVYYNNQGSINSAPYAALDHDDVTGYGPETTTIYQFFNGTYHFYIYKYAGTGTLTSSSAVVQIYNETGLIYTLQVPTTGTGDYWYVATLNGASQALNIINTIQEAEPGTGKRDVVYPKKPDQGNKQISEITSWDWNFGDGQSSTLQNPNHIYELDGYYTVSLTVGDGSNTHTETKVDYIKVGPEFSIEELTPEAISLYPNPANSIVEFISEFEISQLKIFDNSGRLILDKKVTGKSTIINVESLNSGIYMVHVYIEDNILTKKLIIQ